MCIEADDTGVGLRNNPAIRHRFESFAWGRSQSMSTTINRQDPRFELARRTLNGRFPAPDQIVKQVEYCQDPEDVGKTLQKVLDAGMRPTARSSGHCYEDFIVNNPNGAIIDISQLNHVTTGPNGTAPYSVGPGAMLGEIYGRF